MSPNLSGNYSVDQARSVELSSLALEIASERKAKFFVCKVFEGSDFQECELDSRENYTGRFDG